MSEHHFRGGFSGFFLDRNRDSLSIPVYRSYNRKVDFHPSVFDLLYLQIEWANCFEGQRCLDFQIVKVPVPADQDSRPNDEIENDPFFGPHLST